VVTSGPGLQTFSPIAAVSICSIAWSNSGVG